MILDFAESTRTGDVESPQASSDSAESPAAAVRCCAAASASAGTSVAERTEWTGSTRASNSAPGGEDARRSLLDRLLDEGDAVRSIEPTAADAGDDLRDSVAPAPSEHEAEPPEQQPAPRAGSVLRDRAAAARKAFNRANALVELAQGYFRGDRPDRSPIEVMITVPASVLRNEHADPVEVGELGESFLSRDAARRLSCGSRRIGSTRCAAR